MRTIRISLAQINPIVGALEGNRDKIIDYMARAKKAGADIVAFPELAITGYPPEDLLLKPQFVKDNIRALEEITHAAKGITAIVGFVDIRDRLYDAAAVLSQGKCVHVYHKMLLPNYGVFDEYRYFTPGARFPVITVNSVKIGLNICEDIWFAEGPAGIQARAGAELIIAINASPYHRGKGKERMLMLAERAKANKVSVAYVNTVGGQDELVFDGYSMILDPKGKMLASGKQFEEELLTFDLSFPGPVRSEDFNVTGRSEQADFIDSIVIKGKPSPKKSTLPRTFQKPYPLTEEIYRALVLGTGDYVRKTGFKDVVIGLSGGIDSSRVAAIAVEALGKEHVHGVFMPSPYSSDESRIDAAQLARHLGISLLTIPIHQPFHSFLNTLRGPFAKTETDVTEENLQSRIRGNIMMALSNKFGWLVLTTGNKSEMSTGYATLYGDMAGGFAVIKDVPKTLVYEVCRFINRSAGKILIPKRVLTKAPTAELRPNQRDSDSLPEYAILDPILKAYVEDHMEFAEILRMGFDRLTVERVIQLVDKSEYKRRQAPPGVKITPRGLGKDRRFPITNRYKSY